MDLSRRKKKGIRKRGKKRVKAPMMPSMASGALPMMAQ